MRPVNLIPAEQRRGEHAPLRTGPLPYIVVGALVARARRRHRAGPDRQPDLRTARPKSLELKREDAAAEAPGRAARRLHPVPRPAEQRVATVTSLADSRFDWERVMRELALVLPARRLADRTRRATRLAPRSAIEGGGGGRGLRGSIPGPALEIERLRRRARKRSPASSPR